MGWFDLFGRKRIVRIARVGTDRIFLVRDLTTAATLEQPTARVVGPVPAPTCESCGKPLAEAVIATGLPGSDDGIWNEAPFAVDGWVCERDGRLAYPRPIEPATITSFGREGARAAEEKRPRDADWWLTRMVTDWPGFIAGYADLAQALAARLRVESELPSDARRLIERRLRATLEGAVTGYWENPAGTGPDLAAFTHILLAEHLLGARAFEPAARALEACGRLEGVPDKLRERRAELVAYMNEERWVFADAAQIVQPYLRFSGKAPAAVDTPALRTQVVRATETLAAYFDEHPQHWQSGCTAAMAAAALDDPERALEAWRKVWALHPAEAAIVREYGLELLRQDRIAEARDMARDSTTRIPGDATIWCNRAVVELLAGDLDEAERCLASSRRLDPDDKIAGILRRKLDAYRAGRPLPTTLRELERSGAT
ncbi:MAG: tetratricopeptide repeat protein [Myxococcales bacterium]|nr:tetratricopeptide repeat protein [Myxococcales bacterium]